MGSKESKIKIAKGIYVPTTRLSKNTDSPERDRGEQEKKQQSSKEKDPQELSSPGPGHFYLERRNDMLGTILIVLLILMLVGAIPTWPHSRKWGYYPSGLLGVVLVILVILLLLGRL